MPAVYSTSGCVGERQRGLSWWDYGERVCATDKVRQTSGLAEPRCLLVAVSYFVPVWSLELCKAGAEEPRYWENPKEHWERSSQSTLFSNTSSAQKEYVLVVNFRWFEETIATKIQDSVFPPGNGHHQYCRLVCVLAFFKFYFKLRYSRTGKSGMLQSMGLQRVGHDLMTEQ